MLVTIPVQLNAQHGEESKAAIPVVINQVTSKSPFCDSTLINKPLPSFTLKTPDGRVLKSSGLKGKVLVLDFWATWCAPCRKLSAELDSLFEKYFPRKDFQAIGVDYNEMLVSKGADAVTYWREHHYRFPMTVNDNEYGKIVKAGNPTVIVIDQKGIIRGKWDGRTPGTAHEILLLVNSLLN